MADQETEPRGAVRYSMRIQPHALLLGVVRNATQRFLRKVKGNPLISLPKINQNVRKKSSDLEPILKSADDGNGD